MNRVGVLVREAREKQGMAQIALGRAVGLSQAHVSNIEHGYVPMPPATRGAFARVLGLSEADLFEPDKATLDAVIARLTEAGRCDRAVRVVREMAGGGA